MASLVTQPADVVKTHIQVSRSPRSMREVARHIYTVRLSLTLDTCSGNTRLTLTHPLLPTGAGGGRLFPGRCPQVPAPYSDGCHGVDGLRAADGSDGSQIVRSSSASWRRGAVPICCGSEAPLLKPESVCLEGCLVEQDPLGVCLAGKVDPQAALRSTSTWNHLQPPAGGAEALRSLMLLLGCDQ